MSEFLNSPAVHQVPVPAGQEHVRAVIRHRGKRMELARMVRASTTEGRFDFEWCIGAETAEDEKRRAQVEESLDFLSGLADGPGLWYYLIYHCGTAANLYAAEGGEVFWEWHVL